MAAHLLVVLLRRLGLESTEWARAQAGTLRNRVLKIGAIVTVSVRRVYLRLSSAFPLREVFLQVIERLRRPAPA